ncbi:uncharacterized protein LJ264_002216 [Porphyrio hochstetteri]
MKIIAFDETNQEVPAEDVKRKLWEQKNNIEMELEKIFLTSVTAVIEEAPADSATPELIAAIVLGVLLACILVAFLVYVLFALKRKRKYKQQSLVNLQSGITQGFDNPGATDKNGSMKSLEKLEHTDNVKTVTFSNVEDIIGGNADSNADNDVLQAKGKWNYLKTRDSNSEHEENEASEKGAELKNVDAVPAVAFTTKQDQESIRSLTPNSTTSAPGKELKGVKFSEVAIILDADAEGVESDDDNAF